ncbi:MAG: hypothetical protein IAC07_02110 [Bacteroidetes bacterium]|uniref:Uncharacterized protein n=1 Tax=Candidatus Cryptobacteroides gallistercoris TaxID=2840765 RepID=A0A940IG00_9BACT|nr:hypothetical protein [Candidatus Cryptobacteroides gallistercoris]
MGYKAEDNRKFAVCLECGDEIQYGRTDRKFCCENCKNKYHNRMTRNSRNVKLRIINSLHKNYKILERMLKLGLDSIDMTELKHLGFDPSFVTSYRKFRRHDEFCCFDIRFIMTPNRIYSVSRLQTALADNEEDEPEKSVHSHR